VLHPTAVFRPGSFTPSDVPGEYLGYILGQASKGVTVTDKGKARIDGKPATVFTATTTASLDGSIGCPTPTTPADTCFGFQPEFSLRMAVLELDAGPVVLWLRSSAESAADVEAQVQRFDEILAGLSFD
jgi:hypothetical protein